MKEYVFSFNTEMESNGNKYNIPEETAYGPYDSEKEAILEAIRMCKYYNLNFTHLFIGKAGYFVPRIDADLVLGDLAQRAVDNGYNDYEYLANVKNEHIRELDEILTKAYLTWENKHPEYRNSSYLMTNAVKYSISELKEEMRKGGTK